MKRILLGQDQARWTSLTLYTYDDGEYVDIVGEVSDGVTKEWMDIKYDSFFKKTVWPRDERIKKMKENALNAYDHCPAQIVIMECNETEFGGLRQ